MIIYSRVQCHEPWNTLRREMTQFFTFKNDSSFSQLQKSENNLHVIYLADKTVKQAKTGKNTQLKTNEWFTILM